LCKKDGEKIRRLLLRIWLAWLDKNGEGIVIWQMIYRLSSSDSSDVLNVQFFNKKIMILYDFNFKLILNLILNFYI